MSSKTHSSVKTRSRADSTATSTASSVRRRSQLSQLKAVQARRALEEAERVADARKAAAAAAAAAATAVAEAEAQRTLDEARAEARKAEDAAELDSLELRLIEEESQQSIGEVEQREVDDETSPPREPAARLRRAPGVADPQERARSWIAALPNEIGDLRRERREADDDESPPREPAERHRRASRDVDPFARTWVTARPNGRGESRGTPALPRITLDKFDGTPLEWPRWSGLFKALVHENTTLTDTERLTHLQSCLTGEARDAVRGLLCDGALYPEALRELEEQFGDPAAVVQHTLASVMQLPPVKPNDLAGLTQLSRALHAAVCTMSSHHFNADLAATTNVRQVVAKLPMNLAWQWGQAELELTRRDPTLSDLDQWLRRVVLAGRRALPELTAVGFDLDRSREQPASVPARTNRRDTTISSGESLRTTLVTQEAEMSFRPCVTCAGGAHRLQECHEFLAMPAGDRLRLARDKKRCFRCLGEGHWAQQCRGRSLCGKDGCRGRHHQLLHTPAPAPRETEGTTGAEGPRSVLATNSTPGSSSTYTLLQVVPVRIYGAEGAYIDTCALLDSGADTSLCAEHVLRQLSVAGEAEELRLSNIEEVGVKRTSIKVSLQISPISATGAAERVTVPEVFSVPKLNVRPQKINWKERSEWRHLAGIPIPDTNGRPVEMLLGANVLEAMLQKEARVGPPGQPSAIRTHFGWCLTGSL